MLLSSLPRPQTRTAWSLFLFVNTLNALDAVLTWIAVDLGIAFELNPVVRAIGFGGKLAIVAIASWFTAALRPRALWIPVVALAAVVVWTVVNLAARMA